ncbi:(d)CMP kinase [Candidatus Vesicomyidisocius calyptogenae]|uniref:Cytidylate kinase n=1 Tax=Vesicomyosocius okutanii subsp. Calyptogena okutanii (strain HA) TaxID=412965 RepID=A5CWL3_VESOH|nr:(d)CMP kinase [Candidatus Vesicomyosocius okutanii]BAF61665.1 cytidylate kinase [Candidatus Vesicomyosocius okutanii]
MSQNIIPVLTIDGPSGVGKGTIARIMAQKKNWHLLDSGAIYRAFALTIDTREINIADEKALRKIAETLDVKFKTKSGNKLVSIYLDGKDVSKILRTEKIGKMASKIASIEVVRAMLLKRQKDFSETPGLVADGRDMGTTVFPDALFKVYLTASVDERVNRRLKQLQAQGSEGIILNILSDVVDRDKRDYTRKYSPLKPAKDALIIDSTKLSIDEVIIQVIALVEA